MQRLPNTITLNCVKVAPLLVSGASQQLGYSSIGVEGKGSGCHQPVDVVVSEFSHQLHLLHDVTRDVLLPVEPQLLDPDDGAAIPRRLTLSPRASIEQ